MMGEDLESYRAAWRQRQQAEERLCREMAARARASAQSMAEFLKDKYGCRTVYLIGSLARGEFGERSDIDLVAEGIPPEHYVHACAEIASRSEFPVDLIPLEKADELIKESLASEGIRL